MSKASTVKKQQPPKEPPATSHNELIHEVEETLKQQELERIWKSYGSYIIGGVIAVVLMTAVISGWNGYKHHTNTKQTAALITAMNGDENQLAAALGDAVSGLKSGHRAMAYLGQAGALLHAGKKDEAFAIYKQAAADSKLPRQWRDLAVLLSARTQWALDDGKTESKGDAKAMLGALDPLIKNADSPWHFHARLLAAQIAAHEMNDYMLAHTHLSAIQREENLPPSLKERAKALDHIFSIRAAEATKKESKG